MDELDTQTTYKQTKGNSGCPICSANYEPWIYIVTEVNSMKSKTEDRVLSLKRINTATNWIEGMGD